MIHPTYPMVQSHLVLQPFQSQPLERLGPGPHSPDPWFPISSHSPGSPTHVILAPHTLPNDIDAKITQPMKAGFYFDLCPFFSRQTTRRIEQAARDTHPHPHDRPWRFMVPIVRGLVLRRQAASSGGILW